jgi:glycerol uptake facilitator protein
VAFAIQSGSFAKVIPYAAAQLAGAFAGAALVWIHFLPHWRETPDADIKRACFCTSPAIRSTANNVTSEIIATFMLVFVVGAFSSKAVAALMPIGPLGPYLVSCLVWGIGLSLGGTTGYAINPARDLGPRIAHALLPISNKGHSDWAYAAVPIIGPLLGGCLAGGLIRFLQF